MVIQQMDVYNTIKYRIDKYNLDNIGNEYSYYLESIVFLRNDSEKIKHYGIPDMDIDSMYGRLLHPAYANQISENEYEVFDGLTNSKLFTHNMSTESIIDKIPSIFDSTTMCNFLSQLDKVPVDVIPIAYDTFKIQMPDEDSSRIYKIVNIQSTKCATKHFLNDCVYIYDWPFDIQPQDYLNENTYNNLVYKVAIEVYYNDARAIINSDYKYKSDEELVESGAISIEDLNKDSCGKLYYAPLHDENEISNISLSYSECQKLCTALGDYYIAKYGSAKKFILKYFTKRPELINGQLVCNIDKSEFTNFLYYNDIQFSEEYFDMDRLLTDISIELLMKESPIKFGNPIKISENFVAFQQL